MVYLSEKMNVRRIKRNLLPYKSVQRCALAQLTSVSLRMKQLSPEKGGGFVCTILNTQHTSSIIWTS